MSEESLFLPAAVWAETETHRPPVWPTDRGSPLPVCVWVSEWVYGGNQ